MDTDNGTNGVSMEELFYIGKVTSYGESAGTVRVTREDKDDRVSAELPVLQLSVQGNSFFHMPQIDEQVLVLQLPNAGGKGVGDGYVLGAFYNDIDKPEETDNDVISFKTKDGSYIKFKDGNIELHAVKNLLITVGEQVRMDRSVGNASSN